MRIVRPLLTALAGVEVTTDPILHAVVGLLCGAWHAEPGVLAGDGHRVALSADDIPKLIAITKGHVNQRFPTSAVVG